jgi:putative ABC transport system ATP-binding protein
LGKFAPELKCAPVSLFAPGTGFKYNVESVFARFNFQLSTFMFTLILILIRRTRRYWQVLATLSLGVILATALLASGPVLVDTAIEFGLRRTLLNADPAADPAGVNLRLVTSAALENVELPMTMTRMRASQRRKRSLELLDLLGLADRTRFRPDRLSGGQQQCIALAVALANNPPLLLADEPTGQVDSEAASQVFDALRQLNRAFHTTIVVVTHDPQVAARVDRVVGIRDGRTSTEIRRERNHKDGSVNEEEWVILDQTSRMQLPQVYVDTLAMRGRVKVRLETDHVSVWPDRTASGTASGGKQKVKLWRPDRTFDLALAARKPLSGGAGSTRPRPPAVETHNLWRIFQMGVEKIQAIRHVHLTIPHGVLAVIKGRSGSGKTTLLNLIGGLDDPTRGVVIVDGHNLSQMSSKDKIELRRTHIGFVFQTFGLLPFLSARENIEAPLRLRRTSRQERRARTNQVLGLVGLVDRANHRTYELSGGEQQRVALARVLIGQPSLILADEPTGQLDTVTGSNMIALMREIVRQMGITVVIASHDPKVEEAADWIYELQDGLLAKSVQCA